MTKMILSLIFFIMATYDGVTGKTCVNYQVVSTNPSVSSLQRESLGLYKINYKKRCNGKATFKHIANDRYIYLQNGGTWVIGDSKGYKSCMNWAYLYHPYVSASHAPPTKSGWKYWDYLRNHWRNDKQLMVQCVCDHIQVNSDSLVTLKEQHEIFGRYKIHNDHMCNNQSTYKHVKNNRYIYVDGYDRWVISNEDELSGKDRASPCTHWAYAFHPAQPSPYVPSKTGWLYNTRDTHRWVNDSTLNVICMCEAYRVRSTNLLAIASMKANLLGLYRITDDEICNKRPTFKHISEDLYLYVDNTSDWIISHGNDVYGKGKRGASCDSMGYVYNPTSPAPDVPGIKGWRYYSYKTGTWFDDPRMTVECE